jgi:hypothetical protein
MITKNSTDHDIQDSNSLLMQGTTKRINKFFICDIHFSLSRKGEGLRVALCNKKKN